jgi:DNA-binding NtrC family response regulator
MAKRHYVLVADDKPILLEQMKTALEDADYGVLTARSPFDAYYHLEEGSIDLLVTEVSFAGSVDGRVLAHEVAQRWPEVAILLISRLPREPVNLPQHARFLAKPFAMSAFLGEVKQLLGHYPDPS